MANLDNNGAFNDVLDSNYLSTTITVSTTEIEAKVGASRLTNRQELIIFNDSIETIYFGPTGVTTSGATKGIPIGPTETVNLPFGDKVGVFLIAASGSNSIIIQELA